MKEAFAVEFEETLTAIKWPSKDVHFDAKTESKWTAGVQRLLELQEPYVYAFFTRVFRQMSPVHTLSWRRMFFRMYAYQRRFHSY